MGCYCLRVALTLILSPSQSAIGRPGWVFQSSGAVLPRGIPFLKTFHGFSTRRSIYGDDGTGRDGNTAVGFFTVVPFCRQFYLPSTRIVLSHLRHVSRSSSECRPVEKSAHTVLSPRQNPPPPSRPAVTTCPYRPVPSAPLLLPLKTPRTQE